MEDWEMTNEQFDQLMTAFNIYAERGELEYFTGTRWVQWNGPTNGQLRIKPTPREVYLHKKDIPRTDRTVTTGTSIVGSDFFDPDKREELVRFREVLDNE